MEDYWNKMQQKFINDGQYPQQLPQYQNQPIQNSMNAQQIPKASNQNSIPNEYNNPYNYQDSNFQKVEQFDGIIEPNSNQGHYGFNKSGNVTWYDEIKKIIDENMSQNAKYLCIGTCVIWIIILIIIFKQF